MSGDAAVLHEDQVIDKYRVVRRLGAGGMGAIYLVEHLELKQVYRAMKVLIASGHEAGANDARFEREAKIAMRVTSKHAVKVVDYGHLPWAAPYWGAPYLVMEMLDGDDLSTVLHERGHLSVEEAARHIHEACDALAELHDENVVHRDIKPANLFLVRGTKGRRYVKVLDFGIAKVLPNADNLTFKPMTGEYTIGTIAYMSPEQIMRPHEVDHRTDIWALGVVLYELVTGERPFQAPTPYALPQEITRSQPTPPSSSRAAIPPAFDAVVMKCLQKDPAARFESAQDLMAALQPFIAPSPRESRPQVDPDDEVATQLRPSRDAPPPASMPRVDPHGSQRAPSVVRRPHPDVAPTMPILPVPAPDAPSPAFAGAQTAPGQALLLPAPPFAALHQPAARRVPPLVWALAGTLVAALFVVVGWRIRGEPVQEIRPVEQPVIGVPLPSSTAIAAAAPSGAPPSPPETPPLPSSTTKIATTGGVVAPTASPPVRGASSSSKATTPTASTTKPLVPWNPTGQKNYNTTQK